MVELDIFKFPDELDDQVELLTKALDRENYKEAGEILSKIVLMADGMKALIRAIEELHPKSE